MTDPLACIEAAIESLGSRETRLWTSLEASERQVSTRNHEESCGFGPFGHFEHRSGDTVRDDLDDVHKNASRGDACTIDRSRALNPISRSVQSVESVQSHQIDEQDRRLRFGHLEAAGVQHPGAGVQNRRPEPLGPDLRELEGVPVEWIEGILLLREVPRPRTWPGTRLAAATCRCRAVSPAVGCAGGPSGMADLGSLRLLPGGSLGPYPRYGSGTPHART